jgi:hypothetical protein
MARACTDIGRYKEAVEHFELSEPLTDSETYSSEKIISTLLDAAQMKHLAKMTEGAVESAKEAWNIFLEKDADRDYELLGSFLWIFAELYRPDDVRSVLDYAFSYLQDLATKEQAPLKMENPLSQMEDFQYSMLVLVLLRPPIFHCPHTYRLLNKASLQYNTKLATLSFLLSSSVVLDWPRILDLFRDKKPHES